MELYEAIFKRRAVRDFKMEPLSNNLIKEIEERIKTLVPLYHDIPLSYRFENKTKGLFNVKAPHYLVISGEDKAGQLENAGFMYEQLVLWLNLKGIGSIWLGGAKADSNSDNDIVIIAFGYSESTIDREYKNFRRKPIEEITNDPHDKIIDAVRVAPSGINLQPWYFEKNEDHILVYKIKPNILFSRYKLTDLDLGIALAHYYLGCLHHKKNFTFIRNDNIRQKKGYIPFGIITYEEANRLGNS